jgi:cholera toxin transcriptional activator
MGWDNNRIDSMNTFYPQIKTGRPGGHAHFDAQLYQLTLCDGEHKRRVPLGFSGSRLLERLLQQPGQMVSRDELLRHAWAERVVGQGSLNQQIYTLRQLLGDEQERRIIQTLPRRGYLFNPQALEPAARAEPAAADAGAKRLARWWVGLRTA